MINGVMITSRSNPKIKNILKLQKASERRKQNLTVIEGKREIERALLSGWKLSELYYCEELAGQNFPDLNLQLNKECIFETVSKDVFDLIAYREGSDGLIALCSPLKHSLKQLSLKSNPLLIVLESVEKPGNMGAILRTADAAGVDAVIVCDPQTDLYNPNTIRASLGCIFSVPLVSTDSESALNWIQSKNIKIFATSLEASSDYLETDFSMPSAIILGTEATGLSEFWTSNSDKNIRIEMKGIADSLNVSVSAAIVVFEAVRQRRFKQ